MDLSEWNLQAFCDVDLHKGGDVTDLSLHFVQHEHHSAGSFLILYNRLVDNRFLLRLVERIIFGDVIQAAGHNLDTFDNNCDYFHK